MSPFWAGSIASLLAGLATGIGALVVLGLHEPSEKQQKMLLGFAAGVMLAASFFSLIIPALEHAANFGASRLEAAATVVIAVLLGAWALTRLKAAVPILADRFSTSMTSERVGRIWLFIAAITLHNFPEGMAVGVSFGGGDLAAGMTTALGIGIQNVPEGLAVAGAAMSLGYTRWSSFLIALASGLAEPVAGVAGAAAIVAAQLLLPWTLGAAAGAMMYIVLAEIVPDINEGPHRLNMTPLMIGLAAMMFLDVVLG